MTDLPPSPDRNSPTATRMKGEGGVFWILRPTGKENPAYVVSDSNLDRMLRSIEVQRVKARQAANIAKDSPNE